jgi:nicotinamide phosphoribosyltransferase
MHAPYVGTDLGRNLLLRTDSYKVSHWKQYPPGAQTVYSYIESRGGPFSHGVFFGLQAWLREYLSRGFDAHDIDEAAEMFALHGEPFNRDGWLAMLAKHGGAMPVRIRAVPRARWCRSKTPCSRSKTRIPSFIGRRAI